MDKYHFSDVQPTTLDQILIGISQKYPQKTAVITNDYNLSYQELLEKSMALGRMMMDLGVKSGNCVGYILPKTPEMIIGIYGIIFSGGIFFPIDPYQPLARLEQVFEQTRPKALICQPEHVEMLSQIRYSPARKRMISTQGDGQGQPGFQGLNRYLGNQASLPELKSDDPVYLNFTSGTTGTPKGAVTTHNNIFYNTISAVKALNLDKDDVHLCMFPSFVHPHDIFARPIYLGGSLVLLDSIKPKTIAAAMAKHQVSAFMAVGSIYETLVRLKDLEARELGSLKVAESGGMYLSSSLNKAFKSKTGLNITPVWGSTETTGIALAAPVDKEFPLQSMGKPCPYYSVQVVDENKEEVQAFETGEMIVSGPGVCQNYFSSTLESNEHFIGQNFYTGDLVYQDEQGYFYFQARRSGMLKVGGMRVYPAEVEEVLRAHPEILEVSVVKEKSDLHGEVPKAVIVSKNGNLTSKSELRKYCARFLHPYKIPRIIEFVKELPRTRGGKIDVNKI